MASFIPDTWADFFESDRAFESGSSHRRKEPTHFWEDSNRARPRRPVSQRNVVVEELECFRRMRFQTIVSRDSLNGGFADADSFGHRPRDHCVSFFGASRVVLRTISASQFERTDGLRPPRGISCSRTTRRDKPIPPLPDSRFGNLQLCGDGFVIATVHGQQDNLRSQHQSSRSLLPTRRLGERGPFLFRQFHLDCFPHQISS